MSEHELENTLNKHPIEELSNEEEKGEANQVIGEGQCAAVTQC